MTKTPIDEIADVIAATQAAALVAVSLLEALLVEASQQSRDPDVSFTDMFEIASARLDKFKDGQVTLVARETLLGLFASARKEAHRRLRSSWQ